MRGFTLLEVMIALAIMAGVVLTVITSFNYHLSIVNRDREETVAMLLARAKLDDPAFQQLSAKEGTFAPEWPNFKWKVEKTPAENLPVPGLMKLTLTVTWDDARKKLLLVKYEYAGSAGI